MSRSDFRIHDRHISKVPYIYEPKLIYKLILQIIQSEFNGALITKISS